MIGSFANRFLPPGGAERLSTPDDVTLRELYFIDLFRIFEAACFAGISFAGLDSLMVFLGERDTARAMSTVYLVAALWLFIDGRRLIGPATSHVFRGLMIDILAVSVALTATDGVDPAIATLFLVNVSAAALLLPPRAAWAYGVIAVVVVFVSMVLPALSQHGDRSNLLAASLFGAAYLAATALAQMLRRQVHETHALVAKQEIDLANLTELNELIIRRMRTGVIVVDGANQIHAMNESAWHLTGQPAPDLRLLNDVSLTLAQRLRQWRTSGSGSGDAVSLAEGLPDVVPRFTRLGTADDEVVIFLDDTSLVSRQAEQLTLTSLGRLAASVAHEVRNPLAAISYAAQLLSESEAVPVADQRLVDIVRVQCTRMNSIVENILSLSRRDRSHPELIDLNQWVPAFVEEFRTSNPLGQDEVRAVAPGRPLRALVDPGQLQQVVWNLVKNALRYGRLPDQIARVEVIASASADGNGAQVEVIDHGPGIPKKLIAQIFEPFFTTSEHGTGLGLYIARQLCEANRGSLSYHSIAGGGSCFRIGLSGATRDIVQQRQRNGNGNGAVATRGA